MKPENEASRRELLERFRRWLRDRHLPVTRQRDLVARTIFDSTAHLSVEEIQRLLQDQQLRVGTATIYRSLEVLLQSGLVRSHDFGEGFKRYEATAGGGQHGHLICGRCSGVTEFSTERFERILPIVADEHGFQYQRHRVEVHGLCRACREADYGALARAGRTR
ncbi:MAG: Fur family transcriptional regulator [Gemmatimonadota bacterium]